MSGRIWKQSLACMACLGMVMSQPGFAAAGRSSVGDVRLGPNATIVGTVVDQQGRAMTSVPVEVQFRGMTVARTTSDSKGRFAVSGLRSGLHSVVTPSGRRTARLWSDALAPPSAESAVLLRSDREVYRAQGEVVYDDGSYASTSGALLGGVAVIGAIVGIAAWTDSKSGGPTSP